jgi:hypothetical protein
VGTLSEERQQAVTEHDLRGKDDATSLIEDIEQNEGAAQRAAARAAQRQAQKAARQQEKRSAPTKKPAPGN